MLTINTKPAIILQGKNVLFAFFSDVNNLQKLMPEQVINWKSDSDSCSFAISGMANISMRVSEKISPEKIKMVSEGKNPFEFQLVININGGEEQSEVILNFEGAVNPFLKMMVEKPLTNFFQSMADKLPKAIQN
jgi:hypothetical protein